MTSKMLRVIEEQEDRDNILEAEGIRDETVSISIDDYDSDENEDDVIVSQRINTERGLVDSFHSMKDYFSEQGLEIATECSFPIFVDWISNFVQFIDDDEFLENDT